MIDAGDVAVEVVKFAAEAVVDAVTPEPKHKRRRRRSRGLGVLVFIALLVIIASALILFG